MSDGTQQLDALVQRLVAVEPPAWPGLLTLIVLNLFWRRGDQMALRHADAQALRLAALADVRLDAGEDNGALPLYAYTELVRLLAAWPQGPGLCALRFLVHCLTAQYALLPALDSALACECAARYCALCFAALRVVDRRRCPDCHCTVYCSNQCRRVDTRRHRQHCRSLRGATV